MGKLNVQVIFSSIDGEANGYGGAGRLTTFIRLKGCNLNCRYCDTLYAQNPDPRNLMTIDEIIKEVGDAPNVTVTGGSPLFQPVRPLLEQLLVEFNKNVTIETNGSYPVFWFSSNLRWVVDYKLPSSGMMQYMTPDAFNRLREVDVIKFVISDENDYNVAIDVLKNHSNWKAKKVFSPTMNIKYVRADDKRMPFVDTRWSAKLAEMMIKDKLYDVQYSLQIHKVLWPGAKQER